MLFLFSDHYKCRLDSGGGPALKHFLTRIPGVETAFFVSTIQMKGGERDGVLIQSF